jgi:protein-disulfide isomerase
MQDQANKQSFAIPVAIVLAGLLIGGAVYMSGKTDGTSKAGYVNPLAQATRDITIKPLSDADHMLGSANADITIVEYSDTGCPFCKNFHSTLQTIMKEYGTGGKVAWVYRHFPIAQLHKKAAKEAQASECAADQGKFWQYIDQIYSITPSSDRLDAAQLPVIAKSVGLDVEAFNACLFKRQTRRRDRRERDRRPERRRKRHPIELPRPRQANIKEDRGRHHPPVCITQDA